MKYYKVVRKRKKNGCISELISAIVSHKDLIQVYRVGEWEKATVGGFLVFDSLGSAEYFCHLYVPDAIIYEVAVKDKVKLGECTNVIHSHWKDIKTVLSDLNIFWSKDNFGWPMGTLAFKEVKFLKKVGEYRLGKVNIDWEK